MGSCLVKFFGFTKRKRKKRTRLVKNALATLGDEEKDGKPHYKVYANGLSRHLRPKDGGQFKKREWLYDLHWYEEDETDDYLPTSLPLVVECEWEAKRKDDNIVLFNGIKYDFQKLLVANADLRLMVFRIRKRDKENDLAELNKYFDKAIKSYGNLAKGSKFLFVAFDEGEKQIRYANKYKGQKNTNRNHANAE